MPSQKEMQKHLKIGKDNRYDRGKSNCLGFASFGKVALLSQHKSGVLQTCITLYIQMIYTNRYQH